MGPVFCPRRSRWLFIAGLVLSGVAACSGAEPSDRESEEPRDGEAGDAHAGTTAGAKRSTAGSPATPSGGSASSGSAGGGGAGGSNGAFGGSSAGMNFGGRAGHGGADFGGRPNMGGEPNAAGVDAGGQAASGGAASMAGQPQHSAGHGGEGAEGGGGEPPQPPAGEACLACGAGACGAHLKSCSGNPECAPWLACLKACDTQACVNACDAAHADVARVYYGVYACLCQGCAASCDVAQPCNKKCVDDGRLKAITVAPNTLAETGLYASASAAAALAGGVYPFQVKYPLWSDGATKERYVFVPRCSTIDNDDMNHWQFPIGTRLWKQFSVDGKRVETRFMHRHGAANTDWLYATYQWDVSAPNDPSRAKIVLHGAPVANGTTHDIPDPSACVACHGKLPDKPLGFSAFQLSHESAGLTMAKLSQLGWLTQPAARGFQVPGNAVQQAALGYLHANCGGCHNSHGEIPRENPMKLRLLVEQTGYAQTDAVSTTVGVATVNASAALHGKPRIDPQSRSTSVIYLRMSDRNSYPMPPLGTKFPDTDGGVAAVAAWIDSLPKP